MKGVVCFSLPGRSVTKLIGVVGFIISMLTLSELEAFANRIEQSVKRFENFCSNYGMKEFWLDGTDVMQLLKISPRTLQSLRDSGILPFTRLGETGKIFYKSSAIESLLEQNMSDRP
jgi:hypothetical protein